MAAMTNYVKTRLLTPSEIELWELAKKARDCASDHRPTRDTGKNGEPIFWECYADGPCAYEPLLDALGLDDNPAKDSLPNTISSLLETLEKTRRALAEADDLLIPYAVEYDENDGPCVFGGSEYHEKDVCHACQWHERTAALLAGFKEEKSGCVTDNRYCSHKGGRSCDCGEPGAG